MHADNIRERESSCWWLDESHVFTWNRFFNQFHIPFFKWEKKCSYVNFFFSVFIFHYSAEHDYVIKINCTHINIFVIILQSVCFLLFSAKKWINSFFFCVSQVTNNFCYFSCCFWNEWRWINLIFVKCHEWCERFIWHLMLLFEIDCFSFIFYF